ncbi:MAG TPA: hypothetical protein VHM94_06380 [Acidimicrobiia bacterium]|nr:hypothetical protein [Acidimicrobiia bacterium]
MSVTWIRVLIGVLLLVIMVVAAIPLLVLIDLSGGGSGFGMCPDGIAACSTGLTAGPEFGLILVGVLFALVATVRVLLRMARRIDRERQLAVNLR